MKNIKAETDTTHDVFDGVLLVLEGKLEGKGPNGRPRNNWMVDIKEWTCQPAYACTSQAADRDLWSVIARQPSKRR